MINNKIILKKINQLLIIIMFIIITNKNILIQYHIANNLRNLLKLTPLIII